MCKEYIDQLNHLIRTAPALAFAEIKTSRRDTLFDEIESSIRMAGLPDFCARDIEMRVVRGDLASLRLTPYKPKTMLPLTPAARQHEQSRRIRYERARNQMLRTQQWCLRHQEKGWSLAEILMQAKAM